MSKFIHDWIVCMYTIFLCCRSNTTLLLSPSFHFVQRFLYYFFFSSVVVLCSFASLFHRRRRLNSIALSFSLALGAACYSMLWLWLWWCDLLYFLRFVLVASQFFRIFIFSFWCCVLHCWTRARVYTFFSYFFFFFVNVFVVFCCGCHYHCVLSWLIAACSGQCKSICIRYRSVLRLHWYITKAKLAICCVVHHAITDGSCDFLLAFFSSVFRLTFSRAF